MLALGTRRASPLERFIYREDATFRNIIFQMLSKVDLVFLSCASSMLLNSVRDYESQAWNLRTLFGYWFFRPLEFRINLAYCGAVVAGSQVLRFFNRLRPTMDSDLDIVTRVGGVAPLVSFLRAEGYTRVPRADTSHENDYPVMTEIFGITSTSRFCRGGGKHGIIEILDFTRERFRRCKQGGTELVGFLKVQIIVVSQPPIEHILLTFHSSTSPDCSHPSEH